MFPVISRIVGHLAYPGLHMYDYRVDQELTRTLSLFVDLPSGAT